MKARTTGLFHALICRCCTASHRSPHWQYWEGRKYPIFRKRTPVAMPSQPQDHVYRLIHTMTRAEKRYFKVYCARHIPNGQGIHTELFDAIGGMAQYDEQALRRQFPGAAFMRRFPITKRRLYEALLNSLDAFHAENSAEDKLRRLLHHVEVLYSKALYADASKVLGSARSLARANDKQALLLQVTEWERRIMERGNYADVTDADLRDRAEKVDGLMLEWQEMEQLWRIKSSIFRLIYRSGQAPGPREMAAVEILSQEPLLAKNAALRSIRARFLHHHVRSALAYARNDLKACEKELTACASLIQAEEAQFRSEPDLSLGVMGNLAHVRMRLGRHEEALDGFREFRKLPLMLSTAPSPDLQMKLFVMGGSLELSVLCTKGEFIKATERLADLEEGLAQYGPRASTVRRAELELQAAYACFGAGQHERALRWCNRLLNEPGIEAHQELHTLGRMLNVAVLMELGKTALLDYVARNTRRFHKQHGSTFAMEALLLGHAHAMAKTKDVPTRYALWSGLAGQIAALAKDVREATVLDHIDLLSWAQGHADDRPFHELVKGRWATKAMPGKPARSKHAA